MLQALGGNRAGAADRLGRLRSRRRVIAQAVDG